MARPKRPFVEVFIECPECKSELKVKVNRERVSPTVKPEYDIHTDITTIKQGELFANLRPKSEAKKAKASY